MLQQSLPLDSTIGNLQDLCAGLRADLGDLGKVELSASMLIFDIMKVTGIPDTALAMILTPRELALVGDPYEEKVTTAKCQFCEEEAQQLVKVRGAWRLVCDDCAGKIQHC